MRLSVIFSLLTNFLTEILGSIIFDQGSIQCLHLPLRYLDETEFIDFVLLEWFPVANSSCRYFQDVQFLSLNALRTIHNLSFIFPSSCPVTITVLPISLLLLMPLKLLLLFDPLHRISISNN